jgi:glucose/arabinose dehydrogenase
MKILFCLSLSLAAAIAADVKLPPPYHTPSATNRPNVVSRPDGAQLQVPQGFTVEEWASGLERPRILIQAPGGEVLVAESTPKGRVSAIASKGAAKKVLLEGLDRPYGMVLWKDYLYVSEAGAIKRYKFDAKALTATSPEEVIPLGDYVKGHTTRGLTFDPKGEKLIMTLGSEGDFAVPPQEKRAAIWRCNPDGSNCEIFASGLRNPTSAYYHPGSNVLWASVQERDGLGDDLVPDYFTSVKQGGFYGWPYAYFGPNEDPRAKGQKPELVKSTIVPDVSLGAHTAVIDWKFYTGNQFPARYKNGAFLALHGSGNRAKRVGYSVVFIPFKNGKPSGPAEDFLTGWMKNPDEKDVWGRPTGVAVLKDGSLLVSDDGGNRIWRISHSK